MKTVIIIPARMASIRLPNKPLALIEGKPMIQHVYEKAQKANIGDVFVACDDQKIVDAIEAIGGRAILTDPNLPSGTDRVYAALQQLESSYDLVLNLQGDLPCVQPKILKDLVVGMQGCDADILTPVAKIQHDFERDSDAVVKVACHIADDNIPVPALYFSRNIIPWGDGDIYHHIGIYAFRIAALKAFVSLPPSPLECREKLEQIRALENGMRIFAILSDDAPLGVDRPEDLEHIRNKTNLFN